MSLDLTWNVLDEICQERARQERKWGQQDHADWHDHLQAYNGWNIDIADADAAKIICDEAFATGQGSYAHILNEEVQEAFAEAKDGDKAKLRVELIQVAAVAVAWIEKLYRDMAPTREAQQAAEAKAVVDAYHAAGGLHPCYD